MRKTRPELQRDWLQRSFLVMACAFGQEPHAHSVSMGQARTVAFSPDGKLLAVLVDRRAAREGLNISSSFT